MVTFLKTGTVGVLETFGKFRSILMPGLTFYIPGIQMIRVVNTQQRQLDLKFDVRTLDNAFCHISLSIQKRIDPHDADKALYKMSEPDVQIHALVKRIVSRTVPTMTLTELFKDSTKIVSEVKASLFDNLSANGYTLVDAFVTSVEPDVTIKEAMNKVTASERLKDAARNDAEASRITIVAEAEADRDKKRLNGEGLALQRMAMMDGLHTSVSKIIRDLGISPLHAIRLTLHAQYLDTMKEMAKTSRAKTVFMPYTAEPASAIRDSFMQAQEASDNDDATES